MVHMNLVTNTVSQKNKGRVINHPAQLIDFIGGDDRDRTDGLSLAKAALSQLSYIPTSRVDGL